MKQLVWWQRCAAWWERNAGYVLFVLGGVSTGFALAARDPVRRNWNFLFAALWFGLGVWARYKAKRSRAPQRGPKADGRP